MHHHETASQNRFMQYWPLLALIIYSFIGSLALSHQRDGDFTNTMHAFMGIFLFVFSLLKVFDLKQFADGFQKYDLIGKKFRSYCLVYPFLELLLALLYLSEFALTFTYIFTILLMGVSALGVIDAMRRKMSLLCACMGTVLKVPLSTVTLTEDITMGLMAAVMLAMTFT